MQENQIERRKALRVKKSFPFTIHSDEGEIVTQTKDISVSGAYCHVDKYMPLMTKLLITIGLSELKEDIQCEGVVVRIEEAVPTGYNMAIFFTEISEENKEKLNRYLQKHISYKYK